MTYPKGYLVAIGGAEDKGDEKEQEKENGLDFLENGILKDLVDLLKRNQSIEIITTATSYPEDAYKNYQRAFSELGCITVGHINVRNREEANDPKYLKRLETCGGVFFSGGEQAKLSAILGGTQLLSILKERYEKEPFVIAGTSAGAAAMSGVMMNGGSEEKAYLKGEVELSVGFGFINDVIIDTHFDARGRFARLAQAVATQPGIIGLGLGEDTGIIVEEGRKLNVVGSSCVTVFDGSQICQNNIVRIAKGQPISAGRFGVYLLSKGDFFDLASKEFVQHDEEAHLK